ncbi:hypothetical protein A6C57_01230 [Fibrella sp. ES10-3-2-2]|nr:hypothetical protein A6C57_01230 [Fibrella sp. ES10-3-2-2]
MKRPLLLGLLLIGVATAMQAQTLPFALSRQVVRIYPGNPYSLTASVTQTGQVIASATAYAGQNDRALPAIDQPGVTLIGSVLSVNWSATQTSRLPGVRIWLEAKVNGVIVQAGYIPINKEPSPLTPGAPTVLAISTLSRSDIQSIRDSLAAAVNGSVGGAATSADIATTQAGIALSATTDANAAKTSAATSATQAAGSAVSAAGSATLAQSYATAANASKVSAATSETSASGSATLAQTARTGAETARTGAETARDGAINAATSAGNSAQQAQDQAIASAGSASAAATSASSATSAATQALSSKTSAATSETNAAASATSAAASKTSAAVSETNAAASATLAGTYSTSANASRIAAAQSETNAAASATSAQNSYNATVSAVQNCTIALGNISISASIDMGTCPNVYAYGTLTGNTTLTINNAQPGRSLYLELIQGGAGSFTATFPATVRFPAGASVDWNTTAGTYNAFSLVGRPTQGGFTLSGFYSKQ